MEGEHGARRPGVKRGGGQQIDRRAAGLPADHSTADIGKRRAVEQRPDASFDATSGEQLRQQRNGSTRNPGKRCRRRVEQCGKRFATTDERVEGRLRGGQIERCVGGGATAEFDAARVHRRAHGGDCIRMGREDLRDRLSARGDRNRHRRVDGRDERSTAGGGRHEHQIDHVGIDRVVTGTRGGKGVERFAKSRFAVVVAAGDNGPGSRDHGGEEAGRLQVGVRPHPTGEESRQQGGNSDRPKVVCPPRPGQRADGEPQPVGCGPLDLLHADRPPHERGAHRARRVELSGEPVIPGGRHDSEQRPLRHRQVDARPLGSRANRGHQRRMPGRRPRRQEVVGLCLLQPRREIIERVAGEEDRRAFDRHGWECS